MRAYLKTGLALATLVATWRQASARQLDPAASCRLPEKVFSPSSTTSLALCFGLSASRTRLSGLAISPSNMTE